MSADRNPVPDGVLVHSSVCEDNPFFLADVCYELGGAIYHCTEMASKYAQICGHHYADVVAKGTDTPSVSHHHEVYCRFDAVVTKCRRLLDQLAHVLWRYFVRRDNCPSNFRGLLDAATSESIIPETLSSALQEHWQQIGRHLKDYRDNIHHLPRSGVCTYGGELVSTSESICVLRMPIPDNPESKNESLFTFENNLDALSYCWTTLNSFAPLLRVVSKSMEEYARQNKARENA